MGTGSRFTAHRRSLPRALGSAVAALLILPLAGCVDLTAAVDIDSGGRGTGTVRFAIAEQAAALLGVSSAEELRAEVETGQFADTNTSLIAGDGCEVEEDGSTYAVVCAFRKAEFTDPEGLWVITTSDDSVTFRYDNGEAAAQADDDDSFDLGVSFGDVDITAAFPGDITSVTGPNVTEVDERTVRIRAPIEEAFTVTVTSGIDRSPNLAALLIGLGVVIAAGMVLAFLLIMRRRRPVEPGTPVPSDAPPPPTP